jgi:DNA-binding LacI/PurR family transcriptional regulator
VTVAFGLPAPTIMPYRGAAWDQLAAVHGTANHRPTSRKLDAIIGYNDIAAVGWLIAQNDFPMARRLTVIGFDGTDLIRAWNPLTAFVDLQIDHIGSQAVATVLQAIAIGPEKRANQS